MIGSCFLFFGGILFHFLPSLSPPSLAVAWIAVRFLSLVNLWPFDTNRPLTCSESAQQSVSNEFPIRNSLQVLLHPYLTAKNIKSCITYNYFQVKFQHSVTPLICAVSFIWPFYVVWVGWHIHFEIRDIEKMSTPKWNVCLQDKS